MGEKLRNNGFSERNIKHIIDVYLGGELRGHKTHGLAPFPGFLKSDFSKCEPPKVLLDTPSTYFVEANENPGIIVGIDAAENVIAKAKQYGTANAFIRNMYDWVRPGAIAKYIAGQDCLAIVTNDGSGRSIAPPGGFDPTLGTNPFAYGIPTNGEPLVVEFASAKKAWGNVRVANKFGTELPKKTFLTNTGDFAIDPKDAHSVLPFGEYKGFSLALLIEIMNGSLVAHNMMPESDASSYQGTWPPNSGTIFVVDPSKFSDLNTFKTETQGAIDFIKSTTPKKGESIRIPGENAGQKDIEAYKNGEIEIDDEVWNEICSF